MTTCQVCATPLPTGSRFCHACGSQIPGVEGHAPAGESPSRAREFLHLLRAGLREEYEVEREIGRGGMGIVFLARENALDRHVALKVLPPALTFDESLVERFTREARLAARLDHPNIVPIYRVGQAGDITYFAMKYVTGGSLQSLLKNTPRLPPREAQRILVACAHALGYAHARNIVHRDVKPANILLDTGGRVYVADLGIAKAFGAEGSVTQSGAMIGTPMYMAPEQRAGEPATPFSDQYALAIVGYQMLTGKLPFERAYDRLFEDSEPLETFPHDVPILLRQAITRALSGDPSARFRSMEEFAQAILGETSVETQTTSPLGLLRQPPSGRLTTAASARRRTILRTAALAVVLAGGGAGVWLWIRGAPAGADSEQIEPAASGADAGRAEPLAAAPIVATWSLAQTLPEGAALTLDGAPVTERAGELGPGAHTARVTAPGHQAWQETRILAAGQTWEIRPDLSPIVGGPAARQEPPAADSRRPRAQPPAEPAGEPRPTPQEPPSVVIEAIRVLLQQGLEAHDDGRYREAADRYRRALRSVLDAEQSYRRDGALARLRRDLQNALEASILACAQERQANCPK